MTNQLFYFFIYKPLCSHPLLTLLTAAAEGAVLSVWYYDELKSEDKKKPPPELSVYTAFADNADRYTLVIIL